MCFLGGFLEIFQPRCDIQAHCSSAGFLEIFELTDIAGSCDDTVTTAESTQGEFSAKATGTASNKPDFGASYCRPLVYVLRTFMVSVN